MSILVSNSAVTGDEASGTLKTRTFRRFSSCHRCFLDIVGIVTYLLLETEMTLLGGDPLLSLDSSHVVLETLYGFLPEPFLKNINWGL